METSHETDAFDILRFILQGGCPSPFDRIQGTRQATFAVDWLVEKIEENKVAGNYEEDFQETWDFKKISHTLCFQVSNLTKGAKFAFVLQVLCEPLLPTPLVSWE